MKGSHLVRTCKALACNVSPIYARGLCKSHYNHLRKREMLTGEWDRKKRTFIPADEAREHLRWLKANDVHNAAVADLIGSDVAHVNRICLGQLKQIEQYTHDRIMAVKAENPSHYPCHGAARRIQSLMAFGYSAPRLAAEIGISKGHVFTVANERRARVTAETHHRIAVTFNRLQLVHGGDDHAAEYAAEKGWPVPFMWTEEKIDDPKAAPSDAKFQSRKVEAA